MEPTNYDKGAVYCVGGKAYYPNYPIRCFRWLIFLPVLVALISQDWHHLLGIVMVVLGLFAANARFSPVHGCLVWLPIIGLGVWAASSPEHAIPLIVWGAVAWLAGCIECRMTLVPHEKFNADAKKTPDSEVPV